MKCKTCEAEMKLLKGYDWCEFCGTIADVLMFGVPELVKTNRLTEEIIKGGELTIKHKKGQGLHILLIMPDNDWVVGCVTKNIALGISHIIEELKK